jgi:hypothetical protein
VLVVLGDSIVLLTPEAKRIRGATSLQGLWGKP